MNLEGLEMIVVLVIIVGFVKALEHLGLLEGNYEGRMLRNRKYFILKAVCCRALYFNLYVHVQCLSIRGAE